MTNERLGEPGEIEAPPLSAEMIDTIGRMDPPLPKADFWERLQAEVDGERGFTAGSGSAARSSSSYRAALLAVAAMVVVAMVGIQLLTSPRSDSAEDPQDSRPADPGPAEPATDADPRPLVSVDVEVGVEPENPVPVDERVPETTSSTDAVIEAAPTPDSDSEPASTTGVPNGPIRLEAEHNDLATDGGATWEGWQLWGNSSIEHEVSLPPGVYVVTVVAQGVSMTTTRPEMELRVDGQAVGSTLVDLDAYRRYRFDLRVGPAGARRLAIAFTNDPNRQGNDVDLRIDYTEIVPLEE